MQPVDLAETDIAILGRIRDASNLVLLGEDHCGARVVVKPVAGERPLWDYPAGTLAAREVASWLICRALGWDFIPTTVWRDIPDLGPSAVQQYVHAAGEPVVTVGPEPGPGWVVVATGTTPTETVVLAHRDLSALRQLAVLDVIVNNGDRKGGHIIAMANGKIAAIDHGLTLHAEDKLRTVLWGFAGAPLPAADLAAIDQFLAGWTELLAVLPAQLSDQEVNALQQRARALRAAAMLPLPEPGWPRLPWPAM